MRGLHFTLGSVSPFCSAGGQGEGETGEKQGRCTRPHPQWTPQFLRGHSMRNKVMSCAHRLHQINITKGKYFIPASGRPGYLRVPLHLGTEGKHLPSSIPSLSSPTCHATGLSRRREEREVISQGRVAEKPQALMALAVGRAGLKAHWPRGPGSQAGC